MASVVWTIPARRDLRGVHDWIARDSRQYAAATVRRIRSATARLESFPESGRIVPEYPEGTIRETIVGSYRVLYRYIRESDSVIIISVVHARRQLPSLDN